LQRPAAAGAGHAQVGYGGMTDEWDIDGEWCPRKTLPFGEAK